MTGIEIMIQGSIVALVTPMHGDGTIDKESLSALLDFHLDQGTNGLVAVGTTGESATLNVSEHCDVIQYIVNHVQNKIPVIAGTGSNSTQEAIELTSAAKTAGADACLLVTPYYNKPTQQGLYLHYKAVAEAVDIPQILYNVPGRTSCDLLPETVARLAPVPNIVGVKEATGDLSRVAQIRDLSGPDFALYSGDDASCREFCLSGGNGCITVTGNVAPKLFSKMIEAAIKGDREQAERLDAKLSGLHEHLFIESNPIPVKWAVNKLGLMNKGIRLPLTWLSNECTETVIQAMTQAEVL